MGKYEEALELARQGKPIEEIFPELKESEDERIRKEIISYLESRDFDIEDGWIPWLEKQKEHQEICTKFLAKILKHSAEGFRNVLKKKGIDYIPHESFWTGTAGTFSKQECNEFYKWMDDMTMELVTEETPEYKKGFKAGRDFEKHKEQKPTERVEINKSLSDVVITELGKYNGENYWKAPWAIDSTGLQYPLYFANLGAKWQKEQKPAEWSEEDEDIKNAILGFVNPDAGGTKYASNAELVKWNNWLKSLRPQPHWKPSDEQMKTLQYLCEQSSHPNPEVMPVLESLYNDLKSL